MTHKHRAGVNHPRRQLLRVPDGQDQVLGRVVVGKPDHLLPVPEQHRHARLQSLRREVPAGQLAQLLFQGEIHLLQQPLRIRDEHHLGVGPVLGLRQQIGRNEIRVSGVIGNDQDLRRTGGHVDGHPVPAGHLLGHRHVLVAGAEDLVYGRHGFGAEGEGGNGLRATDFDYGT